MNARIMRLLIYISFLLAVGCSAPDPSGLDTASTDTGNSAIFDPKTSEVPLPNVLATASAKDPLTQYKDSSGNYVARPANTPMNPAEALAYVNKYEMASTHAVSGLNAPIYIRFTSAVDAATLTTANVKVFQLTPDTTSSSSFENGPLGFKDISGMFTIKYTAGSTDVFLFPNFPLSPATRYMYVVTNRVHDTNGKSFDNSYYFKYLKSKFELVGPFAALEPIRANAMSGANIKLSGYTKVMDDLITASATTTITSRDDITLMGRFITSGAGFVSKDAIGTMMPVESALRAFAAGGLPGGFTGKTWANSSTVTATFDRLGTNPSPDAYWTGVMGSATSAPASVSSVYNGTFNSAQLSIDPVVAKANAASIDLTGITLGGLPAFNPAAGVVQSFRDGTGNLTGYYHSTTTIPFVYIVPTGVAPAGGWPLVMFQHGITGQKEQAIAVAGSLTAAGYAVIAIDLPLHGALAVSGHTTGTLWGQDFMAVGAPLATRSNVQQAAFNLHRLELTLIGGGFAGLGTAGADAPNRTTVKPKYVGLSLGSIVGAYYLAGNTSLATSGTPYTQTTLNSDMKGFMSVPGGRLAYLLKDSPAFSTSINAGLAAKGIAAGTVTYNQFFLVTQSITDTVDPASMTTPLAEGLPSRLSGRIAIQEAVGDLVIPNENTRYLGNALGGRGILNTAAALAIAPGFSQLKYIDTTLPALFMYTRTGGVVDGALTAKVDFARDQAVAGATPAEGYFQFKLDGTGTSVGHGFLIDFATPANTVLAQSQMVAFLSKGVVIDPTTAGPLAKRAYTGSPLTQEIMFPPVANILGY